MKAIRLMVLAFVGVGMLGMSVGCETSEGAGRDIERAGEKIQDAAD